MNKSEFVWKDFWTFFIVSMSLSSTVLFLPIIPEFSYRIMAFIFLLVTFSILSFAYGFWGCIERGSAECEMNIEKITLIKDRVFCFIEGFDGDKVIVHQEDWQRIGKVMGWKE